MARGGKQRSRPSQAAVKRKLDENKSYSKNDVYETEDAEAEEDRLAGTRYDVGACITLPMSHVNAHDDQLGNREWKF
jgi:hypothetical protein